MDEVDAAPCRLEVYNGLTNGREDQVDGFNDDDDDQEWTPSIYKRDVFFAFLSLFTFAFDYGTDLMLLMVYYGDGEMVLFYLTLGFIAVPSLVSGVLSSVWYSLKAKTSKKGLEKFILAIKVTTCFLHLGRFTRQCEYIYCIAHSFRLRHKISSSPDNDERKALERKDRELRRRAIFEKRDTAILGLMDGFLESALQLLLQLYLAIYLSLPLTFLRVLSLCLSLTSTSLIHTVYYRANRKANKYTRTVTYFSSAFYFLWRLSELAPRYLLLSLTCVLLAPWCFVAVPFQIGFVYLLYRCYSPELKGICPESKEKPCESRGLKHMFIFMISYLGLFSFVNLVKGNTRKVAAIFYVVFYVENIVMTVLILWYSVHYGAVTGWTMTLYAMPIGMVCHVTFAAIFYECLHPNLRKQSEKEETTKHENKL